MINISLSPKNTDHRNRIHNIRPLPRDTSEAYLLYLLTIALPDPKGKKYYRLRTRLVTYTKKGGILETYKDVLDKIRDKLFIED
ncbi:hypothetical protein N7449_000553 [Penicillium cf. viridicatum]|uniref:Uncharacterized protein n=1 Tax=Penicillium cf. viridicatum TaxID=2972119 RepID=A0A9W9N621_9EURO|nr:hypothetical protein N7449_000553 [Penicillium cf. viridicatum]